ncbi:hypothetical protein LTS18_003140 [Coniosporium uncinatum]|uniref:Uncharacterized protein n=1 Tax=Coniosporium uncinatum TaxID=93489 RepID=A0ACC3DU44_9PEZI|nr:hypothetical protein LTS18_003140 [Coniosporium uncinatum]
MISQDVFTSSPDSSVAGADDDDDDEHLRRCWRRNSCGICLSDRTCGWCESSNTCVPLPPSHPLSFPLLSPLHSKDPQICPLASERWELRTATLGCECSSTTLVAAIITCACTLAGVVVLWGLITLVAWATTAWRGVRGGYEVLVQEGDGGGERRVGRVWKRKGAGAWMEWWGGRGREERLDPERGAGKGVVKNVEEG